MLKHIVIQVSVSVTFSELQQSGKTPVCLFQKKKACDGSNAEILHKYIFTVEMKLTKQQAIGK